MGWMCAPSILPMARPRTFLRRLQSLVFLESREGRPSEVAAYANALASMGLGVGTYLLTHSLLAIVAAVVLFVLLRVALVHRATIWIAASCGTLAVASTGAGLAWLFAHVSETPWAPSVAAVVGAIVTAMLPAWAYAKIAELRANDVPDSLLEPVSIPPSRDSTF